MTPRWAPRQVVRRHVPAAASSAVTRFRFGDLRRVEPVSRWGRERGQPIDRWYIERYLAERADLVRGHALEFLEDLYASRFGATSVDVLDIDASNPRATLVGDVCQAGTLPAGQFDVAVVTQTLQFVVRPLDAVRNVLVALRPEGSLLVTVPTLSRLADASDRWRWTPLGLRETLTEAAPAGADIEAVGMGNGLAARAFLFGLGVADLDDDVLARSDPDYPMVVGARVTLPQPAV